MTKSKFLVCLFAVVFAASRDLILVGQISSVPPPQEPSRIDSLPKPVLSRPTEYKIGRDDVIEVTVFGLPNLGGLARVTDSGVVSLQLVGDVHAGGKTSLEVEDAIEAALGQKFLKDPHVTVQIKEYASQPVSLIGAVKMPGIHQLRGQKLLLDVLALGQGLSDDAGDTIQIMRTSNPGEPSRTLHISRVELFERGNIALNVPIEPYDVVNVVPAASAFVIGEVLRPGEYLLRHGRETSVAQVLAYMGGFSREAKTNECRIIRLHPDGTKEEIPVDLKKILNGKGKDIPMLANDILFVPSKRVTVGLQRVLDMTISVVSGRLIY